jgi:transcription elongation factor GreB
MSKAFTSEETPDAGVVVPARAPLPSGTPNYVTPRGLSLLQAELTRLEAERERLDAGGDGETKVAERMRRGAVVAAQINELAARLGSAVVVDPRGQPRDEVRFGATVTLRPAGDDGQPARRYTIVGVDEANAAEGRLAFVSPLARALLGRRTGEVIEMRVRRDTGNAMQIVAIDYATGLEVTATDG